MAIDFVNTFSKNTINLFFLLCLLFPLLYGSSKLSVKSMCQFYVFRVFGLAKTLSHHMFLMPYISFYHFYEFMLPSQLFSLHGTYFCLLLRVYHCFHHMNNQLHNGIHKIVYAIHTQLKSSLYLMWIFFQVAVLVHWHICQVLCQEIMVVSTIACSQGIVKIWKGN